MQITLQYAVIVQEAITRAWWISHCQSIQNWICNIMLCQLFLCIHLTDKTVIKLMQCSQQNSLAARVEIILFAQLSSVQVSAATFLMNDTDESLTRPRRGGLSAQEWEWSIFQIQITIETSPQNMKSNVNSLRFDAYLHILMLCAVSGSSGWRQSEERLQCLFRSPLL